ncbi:large conductance mechanosensitive channel protein [Actinobacteria bacterium IMCC26207]|nr:large conductance mechanosensitive channel protein [Actinobacteria bacterium IMCC26207]
MLKGFKEFIMRGNVIDLAVGLVIGVAFGAVVKSFVDDVLMAFIGGVFGSPNFNDLMLSVGSGVVFYGRFITALFNFLLVAAAVYFVVIVPMNKLAERRAKGGDEDIEPTNIEKMVALLEQIANQKS